jgi:predicted transcriptional regulator
MRFEGRLLKVGRHWAVEVPILGVVSQGHTRGEALEMIADAVESLVNQKGFNVTVFEGPANHFEIGASDQAALTALLLRRMRLKAGLTLAQVASRLGAKSLNAYARYEQGRTTPSVQKLSELLSAVVPDRDFVLAESRARG